MLDKIKAVISKMFGANDIQRIINQSVAVSSEMRTAITDWAQIYKNKPPWQSTEMRSLNLGKSISKEFARLVLLECAIKVDNSRTVDAVLQTVIDNIRPHLEKALAKGGMAFKPYVSRNGDIEVDFVDAENFYPTGYDSNGEIYSAVFMNKTRINNKIYSRLEKHDYDRTSRTEHINNYAFVSNTEDSIGRRTSLSDVPEWSALAEDATVFNVDAPLFVYFKVPFSNTIDDGSPLGISIFEDAVDLLEDADRQYSNYLWEFEGGELALYADTTALEISSDEYGSDDSENIYTMPHHSKRLIRRFSGISSSGASFYEVFNPQLRDSSYENGLETILRRIEFSASLAYGTLSNVQSTDKTAEEIRASKQRSYSAVTEIQTALQTAFESLAYTVLVWCTTEGTETVKKKLSISCSWDDSMIREPQREFAERLQLMSSDVIKDWEMRMWYFGESEEQAKKMCNESNTYGGDDE